MSETLKKVRDVTGQLPMEGDEFVHLNSQLASRRVTYDTLVLDARLRQSLATVRSLGSRGLRVATLGTSSRLPTFSSRWCQQAFVCPANEGAEAYFSYLEQLLDHIDVHVLITASDAAKERTLEITRQLGLSVPRVISVQAASQVKAALDEILMKAFLNTGARRTRKKRNMRPKKGSMLLRLPSSSAVHVGGTHEQFFCYSDEEFEKR